MLLTKLFCLVLFGFLLTDFKVRKKIGFYKMARVSNVKLLSILYLIDCTISIIFVLLVRGFV